MRACRPSLLLEAYTRRVDAMVCLARFGSHGAHWVHGTPFLLSPQPCRCMFCCMLHVSYGTHAMQSFALGFTVGSGYSMRKCPERKNDGFRLSCLFRQDVEHRLRTELLQKHNAWLAAQQSQVGPSCLNCVRNALAGAVAAVVVVTGRGFARA